MRELVRFWTIKVKQENIVLGKRGWNAVNLSRSIRMIQLNGIDHIFSGPRGSLEYVPSIFARKDKDKTKTMTKF